MGAASPPSEGISGATGGTHASAPPWGAASGPASPVPGTSAWPSTPLPPLSFCGECPRSFFVVLPPELLPEELPRSSLVGRPLPAPGSPGTCAPGLGFSGGAESGTSPPMIAAAAAPSAPPAGPAPSSGSDPRCLFISGSDICSVALTTLSSCAPQCTALPASLTVPLVASARSRLLARVRFSGGPRFQGFCGFTSAFLSRESGDHGSE
mmetsp:Transcript_13689/g.43252  ORF Transcript_13689/g.43252 Transcript_13689/m.43252 type:complete len:209 (-) Transcript_13689:211-837(-)